MFVETIFPNEEIAMKHTLNILIASCCACTSLAADNLESNKPTRFVRIELPGDKRILTLAEVEVFVAGKNIAPGGKATQSFIDDRVASPVSIMPNGVLNTLDKEQILDLLAYLLAGGNADADAFKHQH